METSAEKPTLRPRDHSIMPAAMAPTEPSAWADGGEPSTRPLAQSDPKLTTKFMNHADGAEGELEDPLPASAGRKGSGMVPTRRFEEMVSAMADEGDED